jgi:hypothetical protein
MGATGDSERKLLRDPNTRRTRRLRMFEAEVEGGEADYPVDEGLEVESEKELV